MIKQVPDARARASLLPLGQRLGTAIVVTILALVGGKAIAVYSGLHTLSVWLPPVAGLLLVATAGARRWLLPAAAAALLVAVLAFAAGLLPDPTWDGNMYHKPATVALHEGWNPWLTKDFTEWTHTQKAPYFADAIWSGNQNSQWAGHYPNLSWLYGAVLMDYGFSWESGKSLAPMLAAAVFFYAAWVLSFYTPRRWMSVTAAGLLAACPVVLAQLVSNYVDGATYAAITLAMLSCLAPRNERLASTVGWSALIIIAGLKFTGALFAALLAIPFLVARRPNLKQIAAWAVLGAVILSHPYLNHLAKGLPVAYPVTGNAQIMANQAEPSMLEGARPVTLVRSLFAHTSNTFQHPGLKMPGSFMDGEIQASGVPDTRYAGMGPLFSAALVLSLPILPLLLVFGGGEAGLRAIPASQKKLLAAVVFLLALVLVHAAPWWARYVPFLYAAVILLLFAGGIAPIPLTRILAAAGTVALLGNLVLVSIGVRDYVRIAAIESGTKIDGQVLNQLRPGETLVVQAPVFMGFSAVYHFGMLASHNPVVYQPVELGKDSCGALQDLGSWVNLARVCRVPLKPPQEMTVSHLSEHAIAQ